MVMAPSAAPTCLPSPLSIPSLSLGEVSTCPRAPSGYVFQYCSLYTIRSPKQCGPYPCNRFLAVLDALRISLPQGPHKETKTGPSEAGGGELLGRVSLEQCLLPEHKTPAPTQVNVGEGSHPERVKVYGPGVEKTGLKANEPTYFTVDCSEAGQGEPLPRECVLGGKGLVHWDQLPGHSSRSLYGEKLLASRTVGALPPLR